MEPKTTLLLSTLSKAGEKAADLGKVFFQQVDQEESRVRLFLAKLYQKPISWIFTLFFAPFILTFAVIRNIKTISRGANLLNISRLIAMLIGFCLASLAVLFVGTYLASIAGFFLIKNLFGWITAISFVIGTTFSLIFTLFVQVIVFNLMCFFFLKITKYSIIKKVYEEHVTGEE